MTTHAEALEALEAIPVMTRDQCLRWLTGVALSNEFNASQRLRAVGMLMDADVSATVSASELVERIGLSNGRVAEGAHSGTPGI